MNTKQIGNQLEEIVVSYIKEFDQYCRRTKNSGGSTEIEDILSKFFVIQCKVDNKKENIIIRKKDWDKMINSLPINSKRIPLFVNQQKDKLITVTLDIKDFFNICDGGIK